jgi:hypothetical protein
MPFDLRDQPLFICGHPKAGTSLVRAIFDSHPQLIVYPEETTFFRRYLPQAVTLDLAAQLALADQLLIHIFEWNRENPVASQAGFLDRDYSTISYAEVRRVMRRLAAERCRHPGDILSAAALAYGQVSGQAGENTRWWVEKSPYNEYFCEQIFEWWPAARCIHILRDPRDNYASYRRKHPGWSAEFFAANWKRSTLAGLGNQKRYGEQRYLLLRFEDLTGQPQVYLRRLADFLQIEWDISLAAPTRAGAQWQGNSMFADQFQAISAAPVARWKSGLSLQDAAVIEWMDRAPMRACHYDPEISNHLSKSSLLGAWRSLAYPLRRRLVRLKGAGRRVEIVSQDDQAPRVMDDSSDDDE